jgi:hypothetical protein
MVCITRFITQIGLAATLIFRPSFAQPPAAKEPRHKNVFENKYLRILDVMIRPGDTTLFHRHSLPSAIVFFSTTKTGSQIRGELPVPGKSVAGETIYAAFGKNPIVHRVWNQDTVLYHVMDIELLSSPGEASAAKPDRPGLILAWDENLAAAYRINLVSNNSLPIFLSKMPMLLICISGSELSVTDDQKKELPERLAPGRFIWIEPQRRVQLKNDGNSDSKCILIEVK